MALRNIIQSERTLSRVCSSLSGLVSKEDAKDLSDIQFIISEIRHASVCLDDGTDPAEVSNRLMSLFGVNLKQAFGPKTTGSEKSPSDLGITFATKEYTNSEGVYIEMSREVNGSQTIIGFIEKNGLGYKINTTFTLTSDELLAIDNEAQSLQNPVSNEPNPTAVLLIDDVKNEILVAALIKDNNEAKEVAKSLANYAEDNGFTRVKLFENYTSFNAKEFSEAYPSFLVEDNFNKAFESNSESNSFTVVAAYLESTKHWAAQIVGLFYVDDIYNCAVPYYEKLAKKAKMVLTESAEFNLKEHASLRAILY